jgi:hypothetical protein
VLSETRLLWSGHYPYSTVPGYGGITYITGFSF